MIWCIIVFSLFLISIIGLVVIPKIVNSLDYKYEMQKARSEDKYNSTRDEFVESSDLECWDARKAFADSDTGKQLAKARDNAREKYDDFLDDGFVRYVLDNSKYYSDGYEFPFKAIFIIVLVVSCIGLLFCAGFMTQRFSYVVERNIADMEEIKNTIIAKIEIAERYDDNNIEYIGYQSKSIELRTEAINGIRAYNGWINDYTAQKKSPWTNWFTPDEYTGLEKLDYDTIVQEVSSSKQTN